MQRLYGAWKPDQPPHLTDGLVTAEGVFPIASGGGISYAPVPQFAAASNGTLAGPCLGAAAYRAGGVVHLFAGTATDLYTYSTAGYASVKASLTSSAAVGYRFCVYNNLMLITNGVEDVQQFDPASPSATTDLDASCPTLRFMAVVRGFVVGGYADDDPLAVAWSDNGDPTEWTPGTGEAGLYILPSGGDVTGIVGGEYGLVFQESRIVRMTYTADDAIWQFDEIAADIGCIAPWSLATYGRLTFFLSNKGWMATDGVTVESIGSEIIDRTFLDLLDLTYIDNMSAAVDPRNSLLVVSVPSANPTTQVFIYQYALKLWTTARVTTQRIFPALSNSINLEGLDAIYGNLDAIPVSLDSALFRGGYPLLMGFDGSNRLGTLSGSPMAAIIEDARIEPIPGTRARVRSVRTLDDANAGTVTVATAARLSDAMVPASYSARTGGGIYRTRSSGNLVQVRRDIPAGTAWSYAQGYVLKAVPGGRA
jgi:hypothetical protein